jgi:intracellular multiplication protein IcmK
MKIFFTILATLLLFVFCQGSFAVTKKDMIEKQKAQQEMEQLRQLLVQVSGGKKPPASINLDESSNSSNQVNSTSAQAQSPSAGVVSASSTMVQNKTASPTEEQPSSIYEEAFSGVVNQLLPMTPSQIARLREVFTESQQAAATTPGIPPKPTSSSLLINLSPQAVAPVIRLGAGYITSMVIMDATGQPWPIAAYSVGDPASFNIQWDQKGNTLLIQSSTFYKRSNLAVMLRDLNTPIMITLISGQEAVDYRVDLRVPGIGPNAVFVQNGIPDAVNPTLFDVLNGIPPKGSKELKVNGGDCQAWLLNDKLYLRTRLTLVSPGWLSTMSSIDGTHAYQLQPAPVILALQHGKDKTLTLNIGGLE